MGWGYLVFAVWSSFTLLLNVSGQFKRDGHTHTKVVFTWCYLLNMLFGGKFIIKGETKLAKQ